MTTDRTPTNEALVTLVNKLAADHPEAYKAEYNTDHKREFTLGYSYDDCIVGCVVRELDPDLHADILKAEAYIASSFTLGGSDHEHEVAGIRERLRALFTPEQFKALANAQENQDLRHPWPAVASSFERGFNLRVLANA